MQQDICSSSCEIESSFQSTLLWYKLAEKKAGNLFSIGFDHFMVNKLLWWYRWYWSFDVSHLGSRSSFIIHSWELLGGELSDIVFLSWRDVMSKFLGYNYFFFSSILLKLWRLKTLLWCKNLSCNSIIKFETFLCETKWQISSLRCPIFYKLYNFLLSFLWHFTFCWLLFTFLCEAYVAY